MVDVKSVEQLQRLKHILDTFKSALEPAVITTLAVKRGTDWVNLSTFIRAGLTELGREETIKVPDRLILLRRYASVQQLKEILAEVLERQSLTLSDLPIKLTTGPPRLRPSLAGPFWAYSTQLDSGHPGAFLEATGSSIQNIVPQEELESLDMILRTENQPPFDGIADLAESYLGYPLGTGYSASLFALLTLPVNIVYPSLLPTGVLNLTLLVDPRLDPSPVELSIIEKGAVANRRRYALSDCKVTRTDEEAPLRRLGLSLKLPATNPRSAIVHLIYGEEILRSVSVIATRLNPRLAAHRTVDLDNEFLRSALHDLPWTKRGKKESRLDFEEAVATLLHLAGFLVERTGRLEKIVKGNSLADVLAFSPDGRRTIVAGCVSRNLSPNDITKIATRASELKRELGPSTQINAVLFTTASAEELPYSLNEMAQKDRVIIVSAAQLAKTLTTVEEGGSLEELLRVLGVEWAL